MFALTLFGFQPLLIFISAGFGWGVNIHILKHKNIDVLEILKIPTKSYLKIFEINSLQTINRSITNTNNISNYKLDRKNVVFKYYLQVYLLSGILALIAGMGYLWATLLLPIIPAIDQSPIHAFCIGLNYTIILVILCMPAKFLLYRLRASFLK
jgi:hypothetical protein